MQNPAITCSSKSTSSASLHSKVPPNRVPYKELFENFENELIITDTPLPVLNTKESFSTTKSKKEHKRIHNALAEAMQSQRYVAKLKKMYPMGSETSITTRSSRSWNEFREVQFVPFTPSIPSKYETKLHELDPLISQFQHEIRSNLKHKKKQETKELKFNLDQVVPSQMLSPLFTLPDPKEFSIPFKHVLSENQSKKKEQMRHTSALTEKPTSACTKNSLKALHIQKNTRVPSPLEGSTHGLKTSLPLNSSIDPVSWLLSKHPVLDKFPSSTVNPNIQPLLSSFTHSVLKKCYLNEVHEALPPHRIAEATSKVNVERTIHNVLSGTQKDDVERLNSLLPIDWNAKRVLLNSKVGITHQWEATRELIKKLDYAEDGLIPTLIDDSRSQTQGQKENRMLGNYVPGASYVLQRETKNDYDTNTLHSSIQNLASTVEQSQCPSKNTHHNYLDRNSLQLTPEWALALQEEYGDVEEFPWKIDLSYMDEVQTFKSCVIRFLRDVNNGQIKLDNFTDKMLEENKKKEADDPEFLPVKSQLMILEKVFFPAEMPKPGAPYYLLLIFTLTIAMHIGYPPLAESASRLLCLITHCKVPLKSLNTCVSHLQSSLYSGNLAQQWASAFFLVKLKMFDHIIEFVKKKIGIPCPSPNYSVSAFLLQLPSHYFSQLATSLSSLLNHCSCFTREEVIKILKQASKVWRQEKVDHDWLAVLGTHHVVVSDNGELLDKFLLVATEEEVVYPEISPHYLPIHSIFRTIVKMMFEDWHLPIREQCAEFVVDLDLLPLVMLQLNEMLLSKDTSVKKKALHTLSSMKWISKVAWRAFLACFSDDYFSIRIDACRTAKNLGLCHSSIIKELLKRSLDIEPRVRSQAINVLPYVTTNHKVANLALNELIGILSNELHPLVKIKGARTCLHLLQCIQEKTSTSPEHEESITDKVKLLLSEWALSECQTDALLKKEAAKYLAVLIGGNTLLFQTNTEINNNKQDHQFEDKCKIIEKVRALGHRQQVLETLMGLANFQSKTLSTSSLV